ncbi:GON-4-like protein isoform X2 [Anabrus simplex]|uniref:GON-4-like protein isoform X2 n=1 Tax=Anabrus simplex TaxID=316456 RepID=UPI0034DCD75D
MSKDPSSEGDEVTCDDASGDECSSGGLEIDISEPEAGEWSDQEIKRKRKRRHSNKTEDENSDVEHKRPKENDSIPDILNDMEEEIERQLDSKRAKSNLTVANVKNILKHVITNEHVLAMVHQTMKGNDDNSSGVVPFEPKLTRARTRELMRTYPAMAWPMTPVKKVATSETQELIEQEFPEDSSDEEYNPYENLEQSEDEKENESALSDLDSQPQTPASACSEKPSNNDCATQTSWSDDGVFRKPQENIGQRTRSKLSLSDTPLETIERSFVPPDITTDMYDSECDDEDWKNFLKDFTEPLYLNDTLDDDEADPEYNVLADEEQEVVDKEELRMDRAVKISRKELNTLMAELFEFTDMFSSDDEAAKTDQGPSADSVADADASACEGAAPLDSSPQLLSSPSPPRPEQQIHLALPVISPVKLEPTVDESIRISLEQRLLLDQHMRKHVQLLTQHFLQTYCHPQLGYYAAACKRDLASLKYLAGDNPHSAFLAANLMDAIQLIEKWEEELSSSRSERDSYQSFILREINKGRFEWNRRRMYTCAFPPKMMEVVSRSSVFLYPLLLPPVPFRCDGFRKPQYLLSEDELVAIGLEQFMEYAQNNPSLFPKKWTMTHVLPLITAYMLPTKDPKHLYFHIRKCSHIKFNPIKYYFENKVAPPTEHYVIPYNKDLVKAPCEQPKALLPHIWQEYIFKKTLGEYG